VRRLARDVIAARSHRGPRMNAADARISSWTHAASRGVHSPIGASAQVDVARP
jgi:hypothetical protein